MTLKKKAKHKHTSHKDFAEDFLVAIRTIPHLMIKVRQKRLVFAAFEHTRDRQLERTTGHLCAVERNTLHHARTHLQVLLCVRDAAGLLLLGGALADPHVHLKMSEIDALMDRA
jgi:hypothetical protein